MTGARRAARDALAAAGLRPQKRFGQHFLCDEDVARRIVGAAELDASSVALEIGPGLGALTVPLAAICRRLYVVEIDRGLAALHRARRGVEVLEGDALALPLGELVSETNVTVVGNLPYNVATPILFRLHALRDRFPRAVVMLQREVAQRIVAGPGSRARGVLSVLLQTHASVEILFGVPSRSFEPRPRVGSTVIRLRWAPSARVDVGDDGVHRAVVHAAFGQRRKMLRNSLASFSGAHGLTPGAVEVACERAGVDPRCRAETLTLEDFGALSRAFADLVADPRGPSVA